MSKRQSKSPLRSFVDFFQKKKDDGNYTPAMLGSENKVFYDPATGTYKWEGKQEDAPKEVPIPPKRIEKHEQKLDSTKPTGQQNILAPNSNSHLARARQKKQEQQIKQENIIEEIPNNNEILKNIQSTTNEKIENKLQQHQTIPKQQQQKKEAIIQQPQQQNINDQQQNITQLTYLEKERNVLQHQIMEIGNAYNQQIIKNDQCVNFIQQFPQYFLPNSNIQINQDYLNLIHFDNKPTLHIDTQQQQQHNTQTILQYPEIPQLELPISNKSSDCLIQIINEQNKELNDFEEIIKYQNQDIENKEYQIQVQTTFITELLLKLEEFVRASNQIKKQIESLLEEKLSYQINIKSLEDQYKQQDLQIRNLLKEKEIYKRQVQNLQRDKEQYLKYNDDLRKQYEEDMQMMNSQLEQSQLQANDFEITELRQMKDQLLIDLEVQKSENWQQKILLQDIGNELIEGFKFLASFESKQIETKIDIQTLCHQYRREYQRQILQKEQSHLQNIQDFKAQIFQINLQKCSLEQVVVQQEKQINNQINDIVKVKKEISHICQEYDQKIKEVNEQKQFVLKELKQCEDQLFQTNLKVITKQQELKQQQQNNIIELNEKNINLEKDLKNTLIQLDILNKQIISNSQENTKLKNQILTLNENISQLEFEKTQQNKILLNLEKDLSNEKKSFEEFKLKNQNFINDIQYQKNELQNQLTEVIEQLQQTENDLEASNTLIQEMTNQLKENESLQIIKKEFEQLKVDYSKLQQLYSEEQEKFQQAQEQLNDLQVRLQDQSQLQTQFEIVKNNNIQLNEEYQKQKEKNIELEQTSQQLEIIITQLNEQLQSDESVQLQNEQMKQLEMNIETITKENQELKAQLLIKMSQYQELNNDKSINNYQIAELTQIQTQLNLEKEQVLDRLQLLIQESQEKTNCINLLKNENDILQSKYETHKTEKESTIELLNEEIKNLIQQNEQLNNNINQQQQQIQKDIQSNEQDNEQSLTDLKQENNVLSEEISKLVDEIQLLDAEKLQFQKQVEELKNQCEIQLNTIVELRSKQYDENQSRQVYNQQFDEENKKQKIIILDYQQKIEQLLKQIQELEQQQNNQTNKNNENQIIKTEYMNYKTQTQDLLIEQNQKLQKMEQEITSLTSKLAQVTAQRDDYQEQLSFKSKTNSQIQQPKGIVGRLAGFFATESELKKMSQQE